jgi:hypothetical protein
MRIAACRDTVRNLGIAATIALSVVSVSGCGKDTSTESSPPTSATPTPPTAMPPTTAKPPPETPDTRCGGLTWPRPMPAVVGLIVDPLSEAVQPLTCLDGVKWMGPDGRVLAGLADGVRLRVTSVSPAPGALVGPDDPVTVNAETVDTTAPPTYHPCDWVSTTEAEALLGVTPITTTAEGGEQGSTDIRCDYGHNEAPYGSPDRHGVSSQLRLTAAHVVDAASEFAFGTAKESTPVDGIGIKAACASVPKCPGDKPIHRLYVLLAGERLYVATGWGGESCDVLEQFAHAAIPRIPA